MKSGASSKSPSRLGITAGAPHPLHRTCYGVQSPSRFPVIFMVMSIV